MPHPNRLFQIRVTPDRIDEVCLVLYDLGYRWGGGQSLKDTHFAYGHDDTFYSIYVDKTVRYGSSHSGDLPLYEVDEFLQEFCGLVDEENPNIESLL